MSVRDSHCTCASHGLLEHYRHAYSCPVSVVSEEERDAAFVVYALGKCAGGEALEAATAMLERRGLSVAFIEAHGRENRERFAAWAKDLLRQGGDE